MSFFEWIAVDETRFDVWLCVLSHALLVVTTAWIFLRPVRKPSPKQEGKSFGESLACVESFSALADHCHALEKKIAMMEQPPPSCPSCGKQDCDVFVRGLPLSFCMRTESERRYQSDLAEARRIEADIMSGRMMSAVEEHQRREFEKLMFGDTVAMGREFARWAARFTPDLIVPTNGSIVKDKPDDPEKIHDDPLDEAMWGRKR